MTSSTRLLTSRLVVTLLALAAVAVRATSTAAHESPRGEWTSHNFPSDAEILAILKQRVEEKRSAGIVVGLIEAKGHQRIIAYGDPGPGQPPLDGNSVFEIGSISKVFTSTVLAELVQEGAVSLDDPAQKYVPASVRLPARGGKQITLGNLSEQNSGLPRMPTNFHPKDPANPYADYTVQQMYDFLAGYTLPRDPGAQFEYSNLGVGLLGNTLATATRESYEALERERVWGPLGMTNTAITLTPWMKQHLALGHDESGQVVSNWDLPALAGAGAIRSNVVDMLKFADANLHPERGKLQRAMAFAHQPRASAGGPTMIGLNWLIVHPGVDTIVWHNGGTGGYRTFIGLEPSKQIAIVVLTNSGGVGADDIGMHLLDPTIPLAPKPAPPKSRTAIELSASVLSRYVGLYELTPDFHLEVTLNAGVLYVHPTDQPVFRLWPETETDFFLKDVDAQITFIRDAQGATTALVLHQGGDQRAKKVK